MALVGTLGELEVSPCFKACDSLLLAVSSLERLPLQPSSQAVPRKGPSLETDFSWRVRGL